MKLRILLGRISAAQAIVLAIVVLFAWPARGQQQSANASATAQAAAPKDLTGYWVSVTTEDWQWRMVVPIKGDFAGIPLNPEGRKTATAWDPARDTGDGQCKAYGAASLLRVPGRLHISWQDANTLRIETDSGMQTRLLHFGSAPPANVTPELQGYSVASWEGMPRAVRGRGDTAPNQPQGYLKVVTTNMLPGYLRRNGVPYSAKAVLEEYLDRIVEPNGDNWLIATLVVNDPQYLNQPYVTHAQFKKIAGNSGWDPTPCRLDEAR